MAPDIFGLTRRSFIFCAVGCAAPAIVPSLAAQSPPLMELLRRPGHVAFMRHALAPIIEGARRETGVTAETLGPCETQRNLNDEGRAEARRIGEVFRREGIMFEHVFTSKWCRCRETAELIMGRPVENLPLINSYFSAPDKSTKGPSQIAALKKYLNFEVDPKARFLMVTHGSLIHDLAQYWTAENEIVVFKADGKGGLEMMGWGKP